jgi:poly(ADP-ribose) glycohydrolase ARH3
MSDQIDLEDRFRGCLLGLAVGDALGAPYEGLTALDIYHQFGPPDVVASNPSGGTLYYTDDTQMMIGVAETLVEFGRIEEESLVQAFVANYHPDRGYGKGARAILESAAAGGDWRSVAETVFPGGSLGNGAAMRVAPVGLLFRDDLDAVWGEAKRSARTTHRHPVGIEAAQILALAVALATRSGSIDRRTFLQELLEWARTEEIRWALRTAIRLRRGDSIAVLGHTLEAHRSVVTAIAAFAACPTDFTLAVGRVIGLGDDTDTLAAMTGALCGAFGGLAAVPEELVNRIEDQGKGGQYIRTLAERLYDRHRCCRPSTP